MNESGLRTSRKIAYMAFRAVLLCLLKYSLEITRNNHCFLGLSVWFCSKNFARHVVHVCAHTPPPRCPIIPA